MTNELCGERWLETGSPFMSDNERIQSLKRDLDRKHRECAEKERQCLVQAEEIERLESELTKLKVTVSDFFNGCYTEVGERGQACMAIDGCNL